MKKWQFNLAAHFSSLNVPKPCILIAIAVCGKDITIG